ncbi:hypothetical protein BROUX41_000903 [Berkeleyomyces rouxiae]|uniref:uncharacterized protein n=1 Tax=Berkeleyomyces rouxiae TaxID=2035830 RepID=UPI003B7FB749
MSFLLRLSSLLLARLCQGLIAGVHSLRYGLLSVRRGYALLLVFVLALFCLAPLSPLSLHSFDSASLPELPSSPPLHSAPEPEPVPGPGSGPTADSSAPAPVWARPTVPEDADWSRFAIIQYATSVEYLCNSLMIFDSLREVNTRADLVLLYPDSYAPVDIEHPKSKEQKLLVHARDRYGVKLRPVRINRRTVTDSTWAASYTKLLTFNLTAYDRVLSIDSDGIVLQNLDELFFAPPATVAAPLAYWLQPEKDVLSSQVLLVTPSMSEFNRVSAAADVARESEYDMEIINSLYRHAALILPHRPYDLLTSEFRHPSDDTHTLYLSSIGNTPTDSVELEAWDPSVAYNEAKYLHFSDWPMPKPWKKPTRMEMTEFQPKCIQSNGNMIDCTAQKLWVGFYEDFLAARSRVCAGV